MKSGETMNKFASKLALLIPQLNFEYLNQAKVWYLFLKILGLLAMKFTNMELCDVDPNPSTFANVTSGSLDPTHDKLAPTCILLLKLHKDGLTLMKWFVPKL